MSSLPPDFGDSFECEACGFALWLPVRSVLRVSSVGFYDDSRFPGRVIVALNSHAEHLDSLNRGDAQRFLSDVQRVSRALRRITQSPRVNISVLGNAEPHIHAHLIPRYPDNEPKPNSSPWDDPRPKEPMIREQRDVLRDLLSRALTKPEPTLPFSRVRDVQR